MPLFDEWNDQGQLRIDFGIQFVLELVETRHHLHHSVAETIEALFVERLEEFYGLLAYHYARAEAPEQALDYLLKAGDTAGQVAADAEALSYYQQALAAYEQAFGKDWDPSQRATLERRWVRL